MALFPLRLSDVDNDRAAQETQEKGGIHTVCYENDNWSVIYYMAGRFGRVRAPLLTDAMRVALIELEKYRSGEKELPRLLTPEEQSALDRA